MTSRIVVLALLVLATSTAHAGEELAITQVQRTGPASQPPPTIGTTIEVAVGVRNSGSKIARVAAGALLSTAKTVLGRPFDVGPGKVAFLVVRIPLESRKVRNDRFTTRVFLADPTVGADAPMLKQLWKDGKLDDNSRDFAIDLMPASTVDMTIRVLEVVARCRGYENAAAQLVILPERIELSSVPLAKGEIKEVTSMKEKCFTRTGSIEPFRFAFPEGLRDGLTMIKDRPTPLGLIFRIKNLSTRCALGIEAAVFLNPNSQRKLVPGKVLAVISPHANVRKRVRSTAGDKGCATPLELVLEVTSAASGAGLQ